MKTSIKTLLTAAIAIAALAIFSATSVVSASNLRGHWSEPVKSIKDGSWSINWDCWSVEEINAKASEAGIPAEVWDTHAGNFITGDITGSGFRIIKYDDNGNIWKLCKVSDVLYGTSGQFESWVGELDPYQKATVGDINVDGNIDAMDCLELKMYLIGQKDVSKKYMSYNVSDIPIPYCECITNESLYDVNQDGTINIIDLIRLMAQITGQWEPKVQMSSDITHGTLNGSKKYGTPPQQYYQSGFEWVNLNEALTRDELKAVIEDSHYDWYVVDGTKPVVSRSNEEQPNKNTTETPKETVVGVETFDNAHGVVESLCKSFKEANAAKTGVEFDPRSPEKWIEAFDQEYMIRIPTFMNSVNSETLYATWRLHQWADGDGSVSYELKFIDGPADYKPAGWSRFAVTLSDYNVIRSTGVEASETFETAFKAFTDAYKNDDTGIYYWSRYLFDVPFVMATIEYNNRNVVGNIWQTEADGEWHIDFDQTNRYVGGTDNRFMYMDLFGMEYVIPDFEFVINLGVTTEDMVYIKDFDLMVATDNNVWNKIPFHMDRIYG